MTENVLRGENTIRKARENGDEKLVGRKVVSLANS